MRRLPMGLLSRSGVEVPVTCTDDLAVCTSAGNLGVTGGLILDTELDTDTSMGVGAFARPGRRMLNEIPETQRKKAGTIERV